MKKILERFKCSNKDNGYWNNWKDLNKDQYWDKEKCYFVSYTKWCHLPTYMKIGIVGGWVGLIYTIVENWNYSHLL